MLASAQIVVAGPPRSHMHRPPFILARAAFSLVVLAAALLCAEAVVSRGVRRTTFDKEWITTWGGTGNCYNTDHQGYYPIDLRRSARARAEMQAALKQPLMRQMGISADSLRRSTPHCILYDDLRRRRGLHPSRPLQGAVIGDSFAYGEGLREEDTLAAQLDARLPRVNFRNLGRPGADVDNASELLQGLLQEAPPPRTVIYFYNLNDVLGASQYLVDTLPLLPRLEIKEVLPAGYDPERGPWALDRLLRGSALYHFGKKVIARAMLSAHTSGTLLRYYFGAAHRAEVGRTGEILDEMARRARARGVLLLVVLYPMLYKDLAGRYPLAPIHDLLMSFCRRQRIRCLDAQQAFAGETLMRRFHVHPADTHPNALANRRVVELIVRSGALAEGGAG